MALVQNLLKFSSDEKLDDTKGLERGGKTRNEMKHLGISCDGILVVQNGF